MIRSRMSAGDKAKDLILKFIPVTRTYSDPKDPIDNYEDAQECALLTVDEILRDYEAIILRDGIIQEKIGFWIAVRMELEKINY